MSRKEEIQNAKNVFQNGTPREKWEFIWDYYKWHLVILAFVLALAVYFIYANVTAKDCVLGGIFLNSTSTEEVTELERGYLDYSNVNTNKQEVYFATNYYFANDASTAGVATAYETLQLISAQVAAGKIDFMVGDVTSMTNFAYWQYFSDLSEVLSEEQMEKYEPYLHYYDRAVLRELNNIETSDELLSAAVFPDSKKPELMEEPVPIFIDVSGCEKLQDFYPRLEDGYTFAFTINAENKSNATAFLEYLFG